MKTSLYTAFHCPKCDDVFLKIPVDELAGFRERQVKGSSTRQSWQCGGCLTQLMFDFESDTIQILEEGHPGSSSKNLVLLKLVPTDKPIYLLVEGYTHYDKHGKYNPDQSYFYNEHTCPTNYLQSVLKIYEGDDGDPHGLFQFVRNARMTDVLEKLNLTADELLSGNEHHHLLTSHIFPEILDK
jgi:hypothetical protein